MYLYHHSIFNTIMMLPNCLLTTVEGTKQTIIKPLNISVTQPAALQHLSAFVKDLVVQNTSKLGP